MDYYGCVCDVQVWLGLFVFCWYSSTCVGGVVCL